MPYKSQAQAGYFHTHKAELEKQGVNVSEWDAASKGKSLPKRAPAHSKGGPVGQYAKGGSVQNLDGARGGPNLPRSEDWKKSIPNRGFLDTKDRFTGGRKPVDWPEEGRSEEDWEKTGGPRGDLKPQNKSENPVKPRS